MTTRASKKKEARRRPETTTATGCGVGEFISEALAGFMGISVLLLVSGTGNEGWVETPGATNLICYSVLQ